jgi:5-methyltetrahydropteroyltriglutamate--homocysteine methyltransferase
MAAEHLPAEQIIAAPDCGLVKLPLDVARMKLANMVKGAEMARAQYRH